MTVKTTLAVGILSMIGCVGAHATTIQANLFHPLSPIGVTPIVIDLNGISAPSQNIIAGDGYTVTFNVGTGQGVVHGAGVGHAIPVAGVTDAGDAQYLSGNFGSGLTTDGKAAGNYFSTGMGTITITFDDDQNSLALLWGSIDKENSLTFAYEDGSEYEVTGEMIQAAALGFASNGYQGPGGSAWVIVNTDQPFKTVTATSGVVSFEFVALAGAPAPFTATPEPSTMTMWAAGAGLLAVGGILRKHSQS